MMKKVIKQTDIAIYWLETVSYTHLDVYKRQVQKGRTYTIVDGIEGRGQFVGVTLATGMNGNNTCWVEDVFPSAS